MTEQWRDIKGWHGRFEVSDQGRVRFTKDNRILPQVQVKGGWLTVYLFHNAKRRWPRVSAEKQRELNELKRKLNEEIKAIKEKY